MARSMLVGAACALCVVLLASAASAQTAAKSGQVYLPTTPGDYSGMILSLMERQMSLLAGADGVETEGTPANTLATLASNLLGVQQAFTVDRSGAPAAKSLQSTVHDGTGVTILDPGVFPNGTAKSVASYYQGQPAVDPLPAALFNLINTSPYGAELAGAFNALPTIPDPLSFGTANFSGGSYNRGPAFNGSAQFLTFAARVFSYTPCFFSGTENAVSIAPAAISVTPRLIYSAPYGIAVEPRAIEVLPRLILIKPVGINVTPVGVAVSPRLISVAPKVAIAPNPNRGK